MTVNMDLWRRACRIHGQELPIFQFHGNLSEQLSPELQETGLELLRHHALKPPYPKAVFAWEKLSAGPEGTIMGIVHDGLVLVNGFDADNYFDIEYYVSNATCDYLQVKARFNDDDTTNIKYRLEFSDPAAAEEVRLNGDEAFWAVMRDTAETIFWKTTMMCLLSTLRYYSHTPVSLSRQVRRAAGRNGQPLPKHWVEVALHPAVAQSLAEGGWTMRPHWRRGHYRHCGPKRTLRFINPVMVNWAGDINSLPKNNYSIGDEDDGPTSTL